MKRPISPEEAANETERRWLARSQGEWGPWCGWCKFDTALWKRHGGKPCAYCPVRQVLGYCGNLPELHKWYTTGCHPEARAIYELAVRMRAALIAEAYETLKELGY